MRRHFSPWRRHLSPWILLAALLPAALAAAQYWNPEQPNTLACQTAPGTADATCQEFLLPGWARGFCAYVFDNASGLSTFNLDLQATNLAFGPFNWTVAGGATKAVANEGASCWYPTTITTLPTIYGAAIADQVVAAVPVRLRIIVDKTAAVSTQFEISVWFLH